MHIRVDTRGTRLASTKGGAPTADELIVAFDVPVHRQAAVSTEMSKLAQHRGSICDGILAAIPVSRSRQTGRALQDRIRHLAGGSVSRLVDGGGARLVVREAGMKGALAVAAMLLSAKPDIDERWGLAGLRFLGQTLLDALIGGPGRIDGVPIEDLRDDAHGYIGWLDLMRREGPGDGVDQEMLGEFEAMMDLAEIDHYSASSLLIECVRLVERDGPHVDVSAAAGEDIVARILLQLELGDILSQLQADPAVVAGIKQRRADRRAASRLTREIGRNAGFTFSPLPLFDKID